MKTLLKIDSVRLLGRHALIMLLSGLAIILAVAGYRAVWGTPVWHLDNRFENVGFMLMLIGTMVGPVVLAVRIAERANAQYRVSLALGLSIVLGLTSCTVLIGVVVPAFKHLGLL